MPGQSRRYNPNGLLLMNARDAAAARRKQSPASNTVLQGMRPTVQPPSDQDLRQRRDQLMQDQDLRRRRDQVMQQGQMLRRRDSLMKSRG